MKMILALIFLGSVGRAACTLNDAQAQKMITRLKAEVVCASSSSLKECHNVVNQVGTTNVPLSTGLIPNGLRRCDHSSSLGPLGPPALSSMNHLGAVLSHPTPASQDVSSVEDFFEYTQKHRARVKALGLDLYRSQPERFNGLSERQVLEILEAHDLEKVTASSKAADGRPFYRVLFDGYGKRIDRSVIEQLNETGESMRTRVLEKLGLLQRPELVKKLDQIEKVADLVDRGMAPETTAEFGRTMDKASSFMKEEDDRQLARWLENKYVELTKDARFKGLSPFEASRLNQKIFIEEAFSNSLTAKGLNWLSARTLTGGALSGLRTYSSRVMKMISSKGVSATSRVADPLLLMAMPSSLACSELGSHDWVQDPDCQPAIGLTPKFIQFLAQDWTQQKESLTLERYTCEVLQKNYQQSIQAPKVSFCGKDAVHFEGFNGETIEVKTDTNHKPQEILYGRQTLLSGKLVAGRVKRLHFDREGRFSESCQTDLVPGMRTGCKPATINDASESLDYLETINYQVQKAIKCCRPSSSTIEVDCSHQQ